MFNLEPGEVTVLILLAVIFLGPSKLPDLAEVLRRASGAGSDQKTIRRRAWSRSDWFLVGATMILGSLMVALAVTGK